MTIVLILLAIVYGAVGIACMFSLAMVSPDSRWWQLGSAALFGPIAVTVAAIGSAGVAVAGWFRRR